MTPKKDSDFYKLKHSWEKICYIHGMPKMCLQPTSREPEFVNFKGNAKIVTSALQKKTFEAMKENWGTSNSAFWLAHPHDREALLAAATIIKKHASEKGFKSFEFVSPFEPLPFDRTSGDPNEIRDLYILVGANDKDVELTHRIRRWLRQPHGASVWVVGVAEDPYKWASEQLGCVPDYMFWMKKSGMSVG